jgi:Flp pilus assembly protein TadD
MRNAIAAYDKKYGFALPGPVTVEVYPDHPDFEVRTTGLPGLGALGVTFGLSVAMDSPSARKPGSFHWASTLWHELSHVYVVTATRHRVPRWFTEGLAVHEETQADAEWGDRLTPEILTAIRKKELLSIAQLDRGFIRPSYPSQVIVSYFQAGRVCDFINSRWGWAKLREMMRAFASVTTTAAVVEAALGVKTEEFDKQFLAWLEQQHAAAIGSFEGWMKALKPLNEAVKAKRWEEVGAAAPKLIREYPEYVEAGNAYEALAAARQAGGDKQGAAAALLQYARQGGRDPVVLKQLAKWQEELGDSAGSEATLTRILWIYPVKDEELHRSLGELRGKLGRWPEAAQEWRAVLESKPIDRASAWYNLAVANRNSQRLDEARDAVLSALEEAPGYRPAQKLLLELNSVPEKKK